ncbi:hypothetical protein ACWDZ8_22130 [Streptomyces sp. NPDC003233]
MSAECLAGCPYELTLASVKRGLFLVKQAAYDTAQRLRAVCIEVLEVLAEGGMHVTLV